MTPSLPGLEGLWMVSEKLRLGVTSCLQKWPQLSPSLYPYNLTLPTFHQEESAT